MKKITKILSLILVLSLVMVGCNSSDDEASQDTVTSEVADTETNDGEASGGEEPSSEDADQAGVIEEETGYTYDGSLKFTGVDGDFEVPFNDILNTLEAVTMDVHHISSSGEEFDDEVTGVLLDTILAEHGLSQKDFTSIRLVAGDGYEITVPAEVIAEHDIILAYEFNGEGLEEKKQPLRAAIDGVRSMYFVSNLMEISFSNEALVETETVNNLVMLETAVNGLESEEYVYYDSTDMAITVADLLASVGSESEDDLFFVASDGYEKTETMDIFKEGYIKFTGEDAPMFLDPDIQKGMYIKSIMKAEAGDITFVSVASAITALGETEVNGKTGVAMTAFFEMVGIDADAYMITATDGYQMEIGKDSLSDGVFYVHDESGNIGMKFTEDYEKSWSMKDILSVEPVGGSTDVAGDVAEDSDTDAAVTTEEWTITFEGLSDGSFDMTSERAERKLDLVELHTERTKNDEKVAEDWTGYSVLDMLAFLHVEEFSSLIFEANDGYQVEIPVGDIDAETIIAVTKNGEAIDPEFKVQLVQNTEFSTTWVKGVVKVTVKGGDEAAAQESVSDDVAALELQPWTVTFDGLSDGSFDFTSEKASQKMTLIEVHTEKEKDDVKYPADWTGYAVEEILGWLKVETYSSLTIVASDGYEVEIPADQIDGETIIAITKDGQPLDSDYVIQLVQNTQFATTWVKGVAKIVVNQ